MGLIMSREIKFRAWDKSRLEMVDDVRVHGMLNAKLKAPNLIFQQYTGLKDIHGVEIYEGDIVEKDRGFFQVYYSYNEFVIDGYDNGDYYTGQESSHHDWGLFEIIGNKFENPELLEDDNA